MNISSAVTISTIQSRNNDYTPPKVNITYPFYPPTIKSGKVLLEGIASDSESGIHNVSAVAHTFPFNGSLPVRPVSQPTQISSNNWSQWSIPFIFNNARAYRIVIEGV